MPDAEPAEAPAPAQPGPRPGRGMTAAQADVWADPSPARIYDYWIGGKDHFAVDREVGDRVERDVPWVVAGARAARAWLTATVGQLARDHEVRQFVDVGSGIPVLGACVHELARAVHPDAAVAYVDRDPIVLAHSRALMPPREDGVAVIDADLRDPVDVLAKVRASGVVDLERPVGVLLAAVLHFVGYEPGPATIIGEIARTVAPGSFVAVSHVVADEDDAGQRIRAAAVHYSRAAAPFVPRTTAEITGWGAGLDVVVPVRRLRYEGRDATVLAGVWRTPTR